jgi:hypothetical protein
MDIYPHLNTTLGNVAHMTTIALLVSVLTVDWQFGTYVPVKNKEVVTTGGGHHSQHSHWYVTGDYCSLACMCRFHYEQALTQASPPPHAEDAKLKLLSYHRPILTLRRVGPIIRWPHYCIII